MRGFTRNKNLAKRLIEERRAKATMVSGRGRSESSFGKIVGKGGFLHHPAIGDLVVWEDFFRIIIKCNLHKSAFFLI